MLSTYVRTREAKNLKKKTVHACQKTEMLGTFDDVCVFYHSFFMCSDKILIKGVPNIYGRPIKSGADPEIGHGWRLNIDQCFFSAGKK